MNPYGNNSSKVNSVTYYGSGGPPNFPAEQGSLVRDVEGFLWEQRAPGLASYWDLFSPHNPSPEIFWSHENWITSSLTSTTTGNTSSLMTEIGNFADTSDYWTCIRIRNTIRVQGLILPIVTWTASASALNVKASIYKCHYQTSTSWPYKPVSNVTFALTGLVPAPEPTLIPLASPSMSPFIITPGKYYIRHLWRNTVSCNFFTRNINDFAGSGTNNKFRTDRARLNPGTINYDTVNMYEEMPKATLGSSATTGLAVVNFGLWGELLA